MGDPWNTVPAWGFPYMSSNVAREDPGVSTLIDGALARVCGRGRRLRFFNNLVYLQLSGYRSINHDTLGRLGADPFGAPVIDGVAPYWRVAVEPHWGKHWLEFGTFGMSARVHPWTWIPPFFGTQTDLEYRPLHRHRFRHAISVSGRQLLVHAARYLHPRKPVAGC